MSKTLAYKKDVSSVILESEGCSQEKSLFAKIFVALYNEFKILFCINHARRQANMTLMSRRDRLINFLCKFDPIPFPNAKFWNRPYFQGT